MQGLVQRLVLKEKQVVQIQSELNRLKTAATFDQEDRLKSDREKIKWNSLMEEVSGLKRKVWNTIPILFF